MNPSEAVPVDGGAAVRTRDPGAGTTMVESIGCGGWDAKGNSLAKIMRVRCHRRPRKRSDIGRLDRDDVVDVLDDAVKQQHLVAVAGGAVPGEEVRMEDEVDVAPLVLEGEEAAALGGAWVLARDHQPGH